MIKVSDIECFNEVEVKLCQIVEGGKVPATVRGLPLIMYTPRGRGGGGSYTVPLRITCKKKGGVGVKIACKIA